MLPNMCCQLLYNIFHIRALLIFTNQKQCISSRYFSCIFFNIFFISYFDFACLIPKYTLLSKQTDLLFP